MGPWVTFLALGQITHFSRVAAAHVSAVPHGLRRPLLCALRMLRSYKSKVCGSPALSKPGADSSAALTHLVLVILSVSNFHYSMRDSDFTDSDLENSGAG